MVLPSLHHQVKLSIMQNYQTRHARSQPSVQMILHPYENMATMETSLNLKFTVNRKITKKTELSDEAFNLLKLLHHHE